MSCGCRPSASPSRTAGTDTTRISTYARSDGDDYIINGQKIWMSRAEHSDLMVLLVRTTPRDQVAKPSEGMSVLLVEPARGGRRTA